MHHIPSVYCSNYDSQTYGEKFTSTCKSVDKYYQFQLELGHECTPNDINLLHVDKR